MSNNGRTKININLPERIGAISANEASVGSTSFTEDELKSPARPKTHHGFKPTAPNRSDKPGKSSASPFLSPRQVSVKLMQDHERNEFEPYAALETYVERDPKNSSNSARLSQKIENSLPSFVKKGSNFLQVSRNHVQTPGVADNSHDSLLVHDATVRTAYPSLSSRLNATISSTRPNTAVQSVTINRHALNNRPDNKLLFALTNNKNKLNEHNGNQSYTHNILQNPRSHGGNTAGTRPRTANTTDSRESFDFHSELEQMHRFKATAPSHESDAASTVFDGMTIESILDYLIEARERGSKHAPFVHVTPRHNIDPTVKKSNFYDLVILERPGNPKSGVVWVRYGATSADHDRILKPHQIMQLSLFGLLVNHADERGIKVSTADYSRNAAIAATQGADGIASAMGVPYEEVPNEIIPLKDFLMEKNQLEYLRTGRFFGLFFELKTFHAWRSYARHRSTQRAKHTLLTKTLFSDVELVTCVHNIIRVTNEIERNVELFCFHGRGAISITDFLHKQIEKNNAVAKQVNDVISKLGDSINEQYLLYINGKKLAAQLQQIKDHHPLTRKKVDSTTATISNRNDKTDVLNMTAASNFTANNNFATLNSLPSSPQNNKTQHQNDFTAALRPRAQSAEEEEIDWVKLRSMQRYRDEFREKVRAIFHLAQFRIDYTVALLLEKFWLRTKQFILGVKEVIKSKVHRENNYWEIDSALFDVNGSLAAEVLRSHNNKALGVVDENEAAEEPDFGDEGNADETAAQETEAAPVEEVQPVSAAEKIMRRQSVAIVSSVGGRASIVASHAATTTPSDTTALSAVPIREAQQTQEPTGPKPMGLAAMMLANINKNMTLIENTDAIYQPVVRRPTDKGVKITQEWENTGSHLCIQVNLCLERKVVELTDFIGLNNIDKLKVMVLPSKNTLTTGMHVLCGNLGTFIENLPNLRRHELIFNKDAHMNKLKPNDLPDLDLGDAHNVNSSNYFTCLVMSPIYNCRGAYAHAIDAIRLIQSAYVEASGLDSYLFKLFEIVRKLWSISPNHLTKQLERSLVLAKVRSYIEDPDSVDDLARTIARDRSRLAAFKSSADYLEMISGVIHSIQNIKHSTGLISSFKPIIEQISNYRIIQHHLLYNRLPSAYSTRCSVLHDFLRKLETTFESIKVDTATIYTYVDLMKRLRNFEAIKDTFDVEVEVTDGMYALIDTYDQNKKRLDQEEEESLLQNSDGNHSAVRALLKSLFDTRHTLSAMPAVSAIKLFNVCADQRERVYGTMSRARSLLLSQLSTIKSETVTRKAALHGRIATLSCELAEFSMNYSNRSMTEVSATFNHMGKDIAQLREDVDATVDAQRILVDAHDIIGAANVVLMASEVDKFSNMDELEVAYSLRSKAWKCIVDCGTIKYSLVNSKMGPNNAIVDLTKQFNAVIAAHEFLSLNTVDEQVVLEQIAHLIADLRPKIQLVSYLSSKAMRARHWQWLGEYVFSCCGMGLKFAGKQSEYISVMDVSSSRDPVGLGSVYKLPFNELVYRGIEKHVSKVSSITAEAVIEAMLESTLDTVEEALRASNIEMSGDWLRDSRLREKIFLELSQVINLTQLSVLVKYCMKAVMVVDNTSQDMCLQTFNTRIDIIKDQVLRIDKFLGHMREIQNSWIYVLHFAKFSSRGEIDRDSVRLFNNCTEDIKKVETALMNKSSNLFETFCTSTTNDHDLSTDSLKFNLQVIMEESHSNVQSILDSCPRLSMLSYNRIVFLIKAWMLGPQQELSLVSECMHGMFDGVGEVKITLHHIQRLYMCSGFTSHDCIESVVFHEPVLLSQSLDEFVKAFDRQLRITMEKSCDVLVLHRINCLQALLTDTQPHIVLNNIGNVFSQRTCQLIAMINDTHLNQTFYLINNASFAEDVWTCLGHPTGCLAIARSDLVIEYALYSRAWRASLGALLIDCKENILKLQDLLSTGATFPKAKPKKSTALLGSLLLQEISFLRIVEELLACKCLESVSELWAARYQLRFQYNRDLRVKHSPIDVVMGSVTVPYGMEYFGAHIRSIPDLELENAMLKVIGSAFSSRGSVFISYDDQNSLFEAPGEYSISCKDVACALGRLSTTLICCDNPHSVRYFIARLVYLDAVGCVDFCSIDQTSLQHLINSLSLFWNAIENRNDSFLQDSLKLPLKTKFTRNDIQTERRKINITELRTVIAKRKKNNTYTGITIIGMASESFYSSLSVFEHFYRSIFNAISIPHNRPIDSLGALLTAEGFVYGVELQSILQSTLISLEKKYTDVKHELFEILVHRLCTSLEIKVLVDHATKTLALYQLSRKELPKGKVGRFKVELQTFATVLWESVLFLASGEYALISSLRTDLFKEFIAKYRMVATTEDEILDFQESIGGESLIVHDLVNVTLIKSAMSIGLTCNHVFVEKCALFWNLLTSPTNNVMIISGEAAVGKTSIRNTVVTAIRRIGLQLDVIFGDSWPLTCRRSAGIILNALRRWYESRIMQQEQAAAEEEERERAIHLGLLQIDTEDRENQSGDRSADPSGHPTPVVHFAVDSPDQQKGSRPSSPVARQRALSFVAPPPPVIRKKKRPVCTDVQLVHSSVIYHASLTVGSLLGSHDQHGRWTDGILLRKLRMIDETERKNAKKPKKNSDFSAVVPPIHLIVLNGPIGHCVEQLFAGPFYQSYGRNIPHTESAGNTLIFPTGELHKISAQVKVVIETNDIQHASPACFVYIPALRVSLTADIGIKRLLIVWMRSVYNWLGDFPPWIDFLEELNKLLLHSKFVEDLLYCAEYSSADIPMVVIVSKLSSFLRYLEDLLKQTHDLALVDAIFVKPEEKEDAPGGRKEDSDDEPTELEMMQFNNEHHVIANEDGESDVHVHHSYTYKGVMTLGSRPREKLLSRARLAIVYAALWGLGGSLNSTEWRRQFENALRDATSLYLHESVDLSNDFSLFDCIFDIREPNITIALQLDPRNNAVIINEDAPIKSEFNHIYADLFRDNANNSSLQRLVFRTPTTRAVDSTVRLLLHTGANVLVVGQKGCGKSMMINDILADLRRNCATPQDTRNHVMENLVDVVNGTKRSEGIFAAMEILRHVLKEFHLLETVHDCEADFDETWRTAGTALKSLWSGDSRTNCSEKTVTSSGTSLRAAPNAQTLRSWFEREFATETKNVLETARFSYGIAFIDDLHICGADAENQQDMRMLTNRPEELLKGILEGTPLFTIKRNPAVRSVMTLGEHHGSMSGSYEVEKGELPVMHKEVQSDPRLQGGDILSDDFILQRTGLISAATGDENTLVKSSFFSQMLSHYSAVGLPATPISELHVALTVGAYVCMTAASVSTEIINVLKNEIVELTKFTLNMCKRMVSSADIQTTSPLERAIRSLVVVDISLVSRFCLSLQYGINNISNPGGLVQLYAHEWKRYFLDPLPDGTQRDRIISLLNEQLDTIDPKSWSVSADWIKNLQDDFAAQKDRVWTDARIFDNMSDRLTKNKASTTDRPVSASVDKRPRSAGAVAFTFSPEDTGEDTERPANSICNTYLPVELERSGTEKSLTSGAWNHVEGNYNPVLSPQDIACGGVITKVLDFTDSFGCGDLRTVMYPAALALVLRMVRILSVAGKHLLLTGYFGTSRLTALHLAAKICNRTLSSFDVKESSGVVEALPSVRSVNATSFRRFLKSMILKATGFRQMTQILSEDQQHAALLLSSNASDRLVYFDVVPAEKLLVVVSSAQQLSVEDRRLLLSVVDCEDPASLFEDHEIMNMTEALRQQLLDDVTQSNLYIEKERSDAAAKANKVAHMMEVTERRMEELRSNAVGDELVIGTPISFTPLVSTRARAQTADFFPDLDPALLAAGGGADGTNYFASDHKSNAQIFTSYSFQWARKHLQELISQNLCLVIDADVPRPMKLESVVSVTSQDVFALLKKRGGGLYKRPNGGSGGTGSPTKSATMSRSASGALHGGKMKSRMSIKERFSLSNRGTTRRASGIFGGNAEGAKALYDPTQVSIVQDSGPTNPNIVPDATGSKKSATNAHGLFTCPLLGPMLSRRFFSLWYDVAPVDAVQGICHTVMKNEEAFNRMTPPSSEQSAEFMRSHSSDCNDNHYSNNYTSNCTNNGNNELEVSPLVLSLRTSSVGVYVPPINISETPLPLRQLDPLSPERLGGKPSGPRSKRNMTKTERAAAEKEEKRRNKFKSTVVLNRYNLLLKSNHRDRFTIANTFGAVNHLGVFKSFFTPLKLTSDQEAVVEFSIASFVEEARAVLPFVLSFPLACDTLILTEPVLTQGPEVLAERASELVLTMIRHGSRVLMTRKSVLQTVAKGYEEALIVLENTESIDNTLAENNTQLQLILRKLSKDIDAKRVELDAIAVNFAHTAEHELELMLHSHIQSAQCEVEALETQMEKMITVLRKKIYAYDPIEWQSFALSYSGKFPSRPHLELMRALMVLINFTPPKVVKGDKGAHASSGGKMEDDAVARYGLQLLNRSEEFASSLCSAVPMHLTSNHVNALRIMNLLMNSSLASELDVDRKTFRDRLAWVAAHYKEEPEEEDPENTASEGISAIAPNDIFETLLQYLVLVDTYVSTFHGTAEMRSAIVEMDNELNEVRATNIMARREMARVLKGHIDTVNHQMHQVNSGLISNRMKIEVLERHNQQKLIIRKGLVESRAYVQEELTQINNILKCMVADACVAVTVMERAGWLPEQLRQECMEQLRYALNSNGITVSDTPFLLGCLVDRLQIRKWASLGEHSLSRDPASINAMSLVHLAPQHCLVVDPDGSASAVLGENTLQGYEQYVITAQRFTIPLFEGWVQSAIEHCGNCFDSTAISLIITDLQAGVSDDLICFLSSQAVVTHDTLRHRQHVCLEPNPLLASDNQQQSEEANSAATTSSGVDKRQILLPHRLRLCLVSTKLPIIDEFGTSKPLPASCMKNVTVIHWSVGTQAAHIVDSRPLNPATEKSHAADHTVNNRIAAMLCNKISPHHLQYSLAINQLIVSSTHTLYQLEQEVITSVYLWMTNLREETVDEFVIPDLVEQAPVSLSFLSDEAVLQLILTVIVTRRELTIDIEMNKSLLRELIAYFSCVSEVFGMSCDFIRMCGSFLPPDILTPYALSSQSLGTNFVSAAIEKAESKNFFRGIPISLADVKRHMKALSYLQRKMKLAYKNMKIDGSSGKAASFTQNTSKISQSQPLKIAPVTTTLSPRQSPSSSRRGSTMPIHRSTDQDKKRFGLMSNSRQEAVNDLNFLLMPMRTFFLREAFSYVQLSVRPGLEWLVKLMLTLATWSQSNALPVEEMRALMYLVQQSAGQSSARYSFYLPFRSNEVGSGPGRSSAAPSLVDGLKRIRSGGTKQMLLGSFSGTDSPALKEEDEDDEGEGEGVWENEDGSEETGDAFMAQLPGTRNIASRVTAYRLNDNKKISSPAGTTKKSIRFSKLYNPRSTVNMLSSNGDINSHALRWLDRGLGVIDGLWLNKRSARWKVKGTDNLTPKESADPHRQVSGHHLMLDSAQCEFVIKNKLVRPTPRNGDPFEFDWLRLNGVRVFGTAGMVVAASLSAMQPEEIAFLRRTSHTNLSFSGSFKGSFGKGSGSPGKGNNAPNDGSPSSGRPNRQQSILTAIKSVNNVFSKPSGPAGGGGGGSNRETMNKGIVISRRSSQIGSQKDTLTSRHSRLSFKIKPNVTNLVGTNKSAANSTRSTRVSIAAPVSAAETDRIAVRMSNMTSGIGSHRSSILQAGNKSNVSLFSDRHQSRFNASITSGGSLDDFSQYGDGGAYGLQSVPNVEDLSELVTNDAAYQNIMLLEQHNSLCSVFKGMASGINRNIYDFADWKENISQLSSVDAHKLQDSDLETLVSKIKPPVFDDSLEDEKNDVLNEDGLWVKGHELTVLQSMLLSEALIPGSSGSMSEVFFALIASYLKKSGHIVQNQDEAVPDDEDEEDGEDDMSSERLSTTLSSLVEGEGTEDDIFDENHNLFANNTNTSAGRISAATKVVPSARSTFFRNILNSDTFKHPFKAFLQDGVHLINCWTKLERIVNGRSTFRGPQRMADTAEQAAGVSKYRLSCRDYNDWESVLFDVLSEETSIEKFVFMRDLRDTLQGKQSSVFLTSHLSTSQMAVFSQRARDLAMHNNKHVGIINCATYMNDQVDAKCQRALLSELTKAIKLSAHGMSSKKVIVEMVPLNTSFGNSVLSSTILHGGHATAGMHNKSQAVEAVSSAALHHVIAKKDNFNLALSGHYKKDAKPWHKSFPLILSSQWGGTGVGNNSSSSTAGCAPLMTLADLKYVWLPRYFSPDVISTMEKSSSAMFKESFADLPPTITESIGILCEELETSLLWVMNSNKSLARSRITNEIRDRLKYANKFEIRTTSCLITIWQLVQYLRSSKKEEMGLPGVWSSCLNPVSLWQLSRLMLKTSDVLNATWKTKQPHSSHTADGTQPVIIVKELIKQERFVKAVCLIAESFSCSGYDVYTANYVKGKNVIPAEVKPSVKSTFVVNNTSNGPKKTISGAASKRSTSVAASRASSRNPSPPKGPPSSHSFHHNTTLNVVNGNSNTTTALLGLGIIQKPLSGAPVKDTLRARKQMKKVLKQQEEARIRYVQQLSSVEKFSAKFETAETNSHNQKYASNHNKQESDKDAIDKEFMECFLSFAGLYVAEVISELTTSELLYNKTHNERNESFDSLMNLLLTARRSSNKMNIKSFLDLEDGGLTAADDDFVCWPDIKPTFDLTLGSLNSIDIVKCLIKWTFDGSNGGARKLKRTIDRTSLFQSMKRLSAQIKAGEVKL